MSASSVLDVPVTSDRVAVGLLVHFLDVAAKRGAFALEESGKVMEAVKYLRGPAAPRRQPTEEEIAAAQAAAQAEQAAAGEEGEEAPPAAPEAAPAKPQLN